MCDCYQENTISELSNDTLELGRLLKRLALAVSNPKADNIILDIDKFLKK